MVCIVWVAELCLCGGGGSQSIRALLVLSEEEAQPGHILPYQDALADGVNRDP